jgi:hypothetical protein
MIAYHLLEDEISRQAGLDPQSEVRP